MNCVKLFYFLIASILSANSFSATCERPWVCEMIDLNVPVIDVDHKLQAFTHIPVVKIKVEKVKIRAGYYPERGYYRGDILYLEGLGDSILNHAPLFEKLSGNGYRIIAFDYMGQGGSTGSMNNTRISNITWIARNILKKYQDKNYPKKKSTVIGWSTGGLAAYMMAAQNLVDQVILIAPGIVPNLVVGGGLCNWPINEITIESLTTNTYIDETDPHLDSIKPKSPMEALNFSLNLIGTSYEARKWTISRNVRGMVFLSGPNDTYVDAKKTFKVLKRNAPHFGIKIFQEALHEIDNETMDIKLELHKMILSFLRKS